ncbi:hypothetical protein D3C77_607520 [compost metagenome]
MRRDKAMSANSRTSRLPPPTAPSNNGSASKRSTNPSGLGSSATGWLSDGATGLASTVAAG